MARRAIRQRLYLSALISAAFVLFGADALPLAGQQEGEQSRKASEKGAAEKPQPKAPIDARVVLLDLDGSAVGPLVEARLREMGVVNWWPRAAGFRLVQDVEFARTFDVPPPEDDSHTSPPLPDAMILLRTQTNSEESVVDLVVCEPKLGRRLGTKRIERSDKPGEFVKTLAEAAAASLRKLGEPMTDLWGVPPFRCTNLGGAKDDLPRTLTREAEQTLLARKGTFLVELEYAHAIAAARRRAGGETNISRPRPNYLLGEYRHEGTAEERRLTLSLGWIRDDAPPNPTSLQPMTIDESLVKLRERVITLPTAFADATFALDNPSGELRLLDAVRREYVKSGDAETQITALEASLLLLGGDPRSRTEVATLLGKLSWQQWRKAEDLPPPVGPPPQEALAITLEGTRPSSEVEQEYQRTVVQSMNFFRRGLAHANLAADRLPQPPPPDKLVAHTRLPVIQYWHPAPMPRASSSDMLRTMSQALRRERAKLIMRMERIHACNGEVGGARLLNELPLPERQELALRLMLDLGHYPQPESRFQAYVLIGMGMSSGWSPKEDERFLKRVETIDHPAILSAVANARQVMAEQASRRQPQIAANPPARGPESTRPKHAPSSPQPAADSAARVEFRPIILPWGSSGTVSRCEASLACGKDTDLFCSAGRILLMKKKGEAKVIWEEASPGLSFFQFLDRNSMAAYDGKYAWIPLSVVTKVPRLLVVDPEGGKVTEVTAEHGLPTGEVAPGSHAVIAAAPLGPGKALLVGSFGQTWVGIARFDPEKGPSVEVIHECIEQAPFDDPSQWRSTKLAFTPQYIATLTGKRKDADQDEQRVIVGRGAGGGAYIHPLLVNPETKEVHVLDADYTVLVGREPFLFEGALYSSFFSRTKIESCEIWRIGFPDFKPELIAHQAVEAGLLAMDRERVHLINQRWLSAPSWKEPLAALITKLPRELDPRTVTLSRSNHYGWIARGINSEIFAVEFQDDKQEPAQPERTEVPLNEPGENR